MAAAAPPARWWLPPPTARHRPGETPASVAPPAAAVRPPAGLAAAVAVPDGRLWYRRSAPDRPGIRSWQTPPGSVPRARAAHARSGSAGLAGRGPLAGLRRFENAAQSNPCPPAL